MPKKRERTVDMSWLQPGVAVEVIMEEPGLIGSRYPAKVLQVTAGKAKVEIPAFDADEEGEEKLQEWVACALVTPPPPPAAKDFAKRVKAGDRLDLWHEDGWWKVSVISRPSSSSFEVVAEGYNAVRVVTADCLRPCLRYVDGEWQVEEPLPPPPEPEPPPLPPPPPPPPQQQQQQQPSPAKASPPKPRPKPKPKPKPKPPPAVIPAPTPQQPAAPNQYTPTDLESQDDPPPSGYVWPKEGEWLEVEVQQEGAATADWLPAQVQVMLINGKFLCHIGGPDPFDDWFSWREEHTDWRRTDGRVTAIAADKQKPAKRPAKSAAGTNAAPAKKPAKSAAGTEAAPAQKPAKSAAAPKSAASKTPADGSTVKATPSGHKAPTHAAARSTPHKSAVAAADGAARATAQSSASASAAATAAAKLASAKAASAAAAIASAVTAPDRPVTTSTEPSVWAAAGTAEPPAKRGRRIDLSAGEWNRLRLEQKVPLVLAAPKKEWEPDGGAAAIQRVLLGLGESQASSACIAGTVDVGVRPGTQVRAEEARHGEPMEDESKEAPFAIPSGFRLAPCPDQETLRPGSMAGTALVGRKVLFRWEGLGWCQGDIIRQCLDAEQQLEDGFITNFVAFYPIDGQEAVHVLHTAEYRHDPGAPYNSWVLLQRA